jgi:hypothetical protein
VTEEDLDLELGGKERETKIRESKNGDATTGEAIRDVTRGRDRIFFPNESK